MYQKGKVVFTINELGLVENPEISMTSGDAKIDKMLIKVLKKMPKWKPAQTAQGQKVKQKFEFSMSLIGMDGC
jgi:TonB family protein